MQEQKGVIEVPTAEGAGAKGLKLPRRNKFERIIIACYLLRTRLEKEIDKSRIGGYMMKWETCFIRLTSVVLTDSFLLRPHRIHNNYIGRSTKIKAGESRRLLSRK